MCDYCSHLHPSRISGILSVAEVDMSLAKYVRRILNLCSCVVKDRELLTPITASSSHKTASTRQPKKYTVGKFGSTRLASPDPTIHIT